MRARASPTPGLHTPGRMRISNSQFDAMVADHWRQRVDRSLRKAVSEYGQVSQALRATIS